MSFDRKELQACGFIGFVKAGDLLGGKVGEVPREPGVYAWLYEKPGRPKFLVKSPAGWFKGRDPTITVEALRGNWIEGSSVVYLGEAGDLQKRLKQRLAFRAGRLVGAWGGRALWQIPASEDLVFAWRATDSKQEAIALEHELLAAFRRIHDGRRPFANRRG
jgi:excinuclease UvrABC nuclease subunit